MLTQAQFDGLVGQQPQPPAVMTLGRGATGQSGDSGPLLPGDLDGATGPGRVAQAAQLLLTVAGAQLFERGEGQAHLLGNSLKGASRIQRQKRLDPFVNLD